MTPVRVVLVTVPDEATAERIARVLLDERMAACVSIVPGVRSLYRFEGKIENAAELQLVIKTVQHRVVGLVARIAELHPYKVPEVLALATEAGLPAYVQWVVSETERVVL